MTVVADYTMLSLNWGTGSRVQERITFSSPPPCGILPPVRMEKVLAVRQQLAEGRYDFSRRLDTLVDRLLKEFNA